MSLFSILYATEPAAPAAALAVAFPGSAIVPEPPQAHVSTDLLDATATFSGDPRFAREELGVDPTVEVYVTLNKLCSAAARHALAHMVRTFLRSVRGDLVVTYLDDIAIKRVGTIATCAERFADMLPHPAGWRLVPSIEHLASGSDR
jgi:hypothetical protein